MSGKCVNYTHCVVDWCVNDVYNIDGEEKVPRHRELNERLAKAILRKWGL